MAVLALTGLILAAATIERKRATDSLQQRLADLAILNDSSRTFLDSFEITSILQTICQLAVTRMGLQVAWIETGQADSTSVATVYGLDPERVTAPKDELPAYQSALDGP